MCIHRTNVFLTPRTSAVEERRGSHPSSHGHWRARSPSQQPRVSAAAPSVPCITLYSFVTRIRETVNHSLTPYLITSHPPPNLFLSLSLSLVLPPSVPPPLPTHHLRRLQRGADDRRTSLPRFQTRCYGRSHGIARCRGYRARKVSFAP